MTETHLIVFDVDGTLVDSQHIIVAAMETAFAGLDLPPPPREEILGIVGLSLGAAVAALAPGLSQAELDRLERGYRDEFVAQRVRGGAEAHAPLYPGARAALERLAADPAVRLGVATGKARRGLDHVLDSHGLEGFFVTLQTADDHPSKPHPSMLETALVETGLAAGRAVMIGDTEFDILMGKAAGFATIGVAWGYHPRARLEAAGADLVIEDFGALDAALAALRGGRP
ncbi:MAG: HAD family hydrolase [Rhodovulum sulfidophilum]|uniref:HAD family hydrolase n=1 Tax=Rhodovulum sulfidophilum TaxID=35806 RepID=A0A2W5NBL6_RHOSU|nr:MAG: HAD family hydrolase [Rhodovulum sulfidophilum]